MRHFMELPRCVLVGEGVLEELPNIIAQLGLSSPLIISGPSVREKLRPKLEAHLKGLKHDWLVVQHPTLLEVEGAKERALMLGSDSLLGLGGGKAIDVAKMAAHQLDLPFISAPTSASHDGIASPFVSLKGLGHPYSAKARPPVAIVADIEVIAGAPPRLVRSGCGDLVAKLTAVSDWELASKERGEYYGQYAASLARLSAELVLDPKLDLQDGIEGIRIVVEALISAGVAAGIAGSSRPCSGSEHLFSHALDEIAPGVGLHGEKCGLGTIMMAKMHRMAWDRIAEGLRRLGAPIKARQVGLKDEQVVEALVRAPRIRPDRYTILNREPLTKEEAFTLAVETGVIGSEDV